MIVDDDDDDDDVDDDDDESVLSDTKGIQRPFFTLGVSLYIFASGKMSI